MTELRKNRLLKLGCIILAAIILICAMLSPETVSELSGRLGKSNCAIIETHDSYQSAVLPQGIAAE